PLRWTCRPPTCSGAPTTCARTGSAAARTAWSRPMRCNGSRPTPASTTWCSAIRRPSPTPSARATSTCRPRTSGCCAPRWRGWHRAGCCTSPTTSGASASTRRRSPDLHAARTSARRPFPRTSPATRASTAPGAWRSCRSGARAATRPRHPIRATPHPARRATAAPGPPPSLAQVSQEPPMATTNTSARVIRKLRGMPTSDGAGVKLTRVIGSPELDMLDPFLMLDEFGTDKAEDYIAGFPSHPHRGFETVTYMLDGRMRHKDNHGNEGLLVPGAVQWMTAGRGVVHSEMPEQEEGRMRGFQLWVNLPASAKMTEPRYQEFGPERIPVAQVGPGASAKVIAGEVTDLDGATVHGPIDQPATSPIYLDV